MRFNNRFLLLGVLLVSPLFHYGQLIKEGTKIMKVPAWAKSPHGDVKSMVGPVKNETEDWVVFSDRKNNFSTFKPYENKTYKPLNFGEAFYVIGEDGPFIHIVKWERDLVGTKNVKSPKTIRPTDDYGWVKKDKMLCWKYSLRNSQTEFVVKAISVINDESEEVMSNLAKFLSNNQQIQLYDDPNLTIKNGNDIKFFNFLFIYKIETNAKGENVFLIGRSDASGPTSFNESIMGWVSEKLIFKWENRLCIEPNSSKEAVNERKNKGIAASMFSNESDASKFQSGEAIKPVEVVDNFEKPLVSSQLRNPVLKYTKGQTVYKTGFQTPILDKNGNEQADVSKAAEARKNFNDLRSQKRKYNYIFVLSGSEVIRTNFYEDIIKSINQIYDYYNSGSDDGGAAKKPNFGIVIYGGNNSCEPFRKDLTSSISDVIDWIREKQSTALCASNDKSEDVWSGMDAALRMLSGHKNEVNILINFGVAMNPAQQSQAVMPDLARRIAEYKCAVVTILPQFYPKTAAMNGLFLSKSKDFVLEMSKEIVAHDNKVNEGDQATKGLKLPPPVWKQEGEDNYFFDFPAKSPIAAAILSAPINAQLKSEEIVKGINKVVELVDLFNDSTINTLSTQIEGIGKKVLKFNPLVLSMYASLKEMKVASQNENVDILMKLMNEDNFQLFVNSYTALKHPQLKYPIYNHVIFVTGSEFDELSELFEKFRNSTSSSTKRNQMITTFKGIIATYFGKEARDRMQNASIAEIMERVTGLPTSSEMLKKTTISAIPDMSETSFFDLESELNKRIVKFKTIKEIPRFRMETGDRIFYWVPEEYLP